ncbi:ABC transporter ATP-binding protein [Candidatus Phytoplasma solani]|uniref:ABC transporter ATP-binding protein n=1 Tax=Candidatus Phytoplasma solani TaxID=69896 RepID=UPI00358EFF61
MIKKRDLILEIKDIGKIFTNKFEGLKGISLQICKGESFGLVGESGSGKSTLGKIIAGILKSSKGQVFYFNNPKKYLIEQGYKKNIANNKDKSRFQEVQIIFQNCDASLNPKMIVYDLIAEGLIVQKKYSKQEIHAKIKEIIHLVGLKESDLSRFPHEFSGGQKQRIVIARALIVKPKIIIADEPVSALDVSIQAQIINLLNDLKNI